MLAVVEDAHWLDPSTRELLDLLVAGAAGVAMLLVVTHGPEFDAERVGRASRRSRLLQLSRLARTEHAALLRRVAGGKALPPEVEAEVAARTDGVPLFVEEVGRAVLESGALREEADRWVLEGPLPQLAVPASLQASLVARLDRLSSVREVAQAGAVIGREFHLRPGGGGNEPAAGAAGEALAQLGGGGAGATARRAAGGDLRIQACAAAGRGLGHVAARETQGAAPPPLRGSWRVRPEVAERAPEVLAHHWRKPATCSARSPSV